MNDLYARNLKVFADKFPEHTRAIEDAVERLGELVDLSAPLTNIPLNNLVNLYPADAQSYTESQLDQYLADPRRLSYGISTNPDIYDSLQLRELHRRLVKILTAEKAEILQLAAKGQSGFLFVFGIGMGLHIKRLLESVDVAELVLIEEYAEFVAASMHTVDWQEIVDLCDAKKVRIKLIVADRKSVV